MNDGQEITAKINTADLVKEWKKRAEEAKNVRLSFALGARTDLGRVREHNEDNYTFHIPEEADVLASHGALFSVADGMGGHSAGQIASEMALKSLVDAYYKDKNPIIEQALTQAYAQANALIYDTARAVSDRTGMGTTMTTLVVRGREAFIAQVGDSRCYRKRGDNIEQITVDHSWVQEQLNRGALTEEEAQNSPYRNVITRSLGNNPSVEADIYNEELAEGDQFLLCSDGLSGYVGCEDMLSVLSRSSCAGSAKELVDMACERGGHDNITVIIVKIVKMEENENGAGGLITRS